MSRATSIAGVRPLGWLARLRALRSSLVWACPAQLLGGWRAQRSCLAEGSGAAGLGPITALGRERAMSMRWLGGQAEGGADRYLAPPGASDSGEAVCVAVEVWYDPIIGAFRL
jgi:hypothetical protein